MTTPLLNIIGSDCPFALVSTSAKLVLCYSRTIARLTPIFTHSLALMQWVMPESISRTWRYATPRPWCSWTKRRSLLVPRGSDLGFATVDFSLFPCKRQSVNCSRVEGIPIQRNTTALLEDPVEGERVGLSCVRRAPGAERWRDVAPP